jgi:hypothetical protein
LQLNIEQGESLANIIVKIARDSPPFLFLCLNQFPLTVAKASSASFFFVMSTTMPISLIRFPLASNNARTLCSSQTSDPSDVMVR